MHHSRNRQYSRDRGRDRGRRDKKGEGCDKRFQKEVGGQEQVRTRQEHMRWRAGRHAEEREDREETAESHQRRYGTKQKLSGSCRTDIIPLSFTPTVSDSHKQPRSCSTPAQRPSAAVIDAARQIQKPKLIPREAQHFYVALKGQEIPDFYDTIVI